MIPDMIERLPATSSALLVAALVTVYAAYRAVRYAVRSIGQFAEWVSDDAARIRVACYSAAAVLFVGGATVVGFGVSRINSQPEKVISEQARREKFMSDIAAKISNTGDTDRLAALKKLIETYDQRYEPSAVIVTPDPDRYPAGAPLVFGGLAGMITAVLLTVRTNVKYD
jgi:hypothetical protein